MKDLKSLEEYNKEKLKSAQINVNTGIACPKCGKEMVLTTPGMILLTHPAKESIHCECGHKDYKYA